MVRVGALHGDSLPAIADELFGGGDELQAFFDHVALEPSAMGGEDEEEELEWLSNEDAFTAVETMAPADEGRAAAPAGGGVEPAECSGEKGGLGAAVLALQDGGDAAVARGARGARHAGTLCNACGVRYKSGRLLPEYQPLKSPTFCPELHSNWHRRVVVMRSRREESTEPSSAATAAGDK